MQLWWAFELLSQTCGEGICTNWHLVVVVRCSRRGLLQAVVFGGTYRPYARHRLSLSHNHVAGLANPASDVHMDFSYRGSRSRCLVLRMVLLLARVRYATGHSVEIPLEAYNVDVPVRRLGRVSVRCLV